jgi:DNA-3-methyladenine glycosylase
MTGTEDGPHGALEEEFFRRPTVEVARQLLGMRLLRHRGGVVQVGRIVETEAYGGPEDLASHSARSTTGRARLMFGPAGRAYVYLIYGMHNCLNVVAAAPGAAGAVLIRALEPIENIELPTSGPGRLCRALAIDRALNDHPLDRRPLWLVPGEPVPEDQVAVGPRIGVDYAGEWALRPWRFWVADNPHVSRPPRAGSPRSRTGRRR